MSMPRCVIQPMLMDIYMRRPAASLYVTPTKPPPPTGLAYPTTRRDGLDSTDRAFGRTRFVLRLYINKRHIQNCRWPLPPREYMGPDVQPVENNSTKDALSGCWSGFSSNVGRCTKKRAYILLETHRTIRAVVTSKLI